MAKQVTRSPLAKIAGRAQKSHDKHRGEAVEYDTGGGLPAGIEGGVGRLVVLKFDNYKTGANQGQPYFLASAVVIRPKEFGGVPIEGQRTQIGPEPLCDTPGFTGKRKTFDDHWAWVRNELGMLMGVEAVDELNIEDGSLVVAMEALAEEGCYIRFRTWKGLKQTTGPYAGREPRVQHVWNGVCEYTEDEEDAVQDETKEEPEAQEPEEAPPENGIESNDDLEALGKSADGGAGSPPDDQAVERLVTLCTEVGLDHDKYDTWVETIEAIMNLQSPDEEVSTEGDAGGEGDEGTETKSEEGEWEPAKGEVYNYKPPKARKFVKVEVTAVFKSVARCNVKDLSSGKIFQKVPWAKLEYPED